MADRLVAWLYDTPVAVLLPGPEFRIYLEWRPEGIERWGLGSPVLSVGLPIGSATGPRDTRGLDFFENMLPEGPILARMASLAGTRPADTYAASLRRIRELPEGSDVDADTIQLVGELLLAELDRPGH